MADSDWEIVDSGQQAQASQPQSDWEVVQPAPNSMQPHADESYGASLLKAPFRVGEDLYRGGMNAIKSIPGYLEAAKTQIPGAWETMQAHPGHAAGQAFAGINEMINNLAQAPKGLAQYGQNRLHLVPQGAVNFMNKITPEDTSGAINQLFGQPQYAGEDLIRGVGRNALNIYGGAKIASALNPLNLTAKGIAKDVLNTEKQQVKTHTNMYNQIWDEAQKSGFNNVPYDANVLTPYKDLINKSYPTKSTKTLNEFMNNPTLENAQRAQSDLGNLRRSIEEKARTTPLLGAEKDLHDAISGAEQHIEGNMFKDANGNMNQGLKNKYDAVTKSYRENVVPYKYNPAIQAYKNKEMLAKELVNSLSRGEFAAKKGGAHPALQIRNMLAPALTGAGLLGGGTYLYNQAFGNEPPQQ